MAALSMPEQLVKRLYSCPVRQGKERHQHQKGPTSSCSRGAVLQHPPCYEHSSCHPSLSTQWLLTETVRPCPAMLRAAWCHRQLKNECQTPQLALPAPSVSPLLPTSLHMLSVCKTSSLSMWVTELKLMPTSPTHKFKPLYTRPTFFPISLLVSFFFNIWFLGFGALFLHAEKMLWMFLK